MDDSSPFSLFQTKAQDWLEQVAEHKRLCDRYITVQEKARVRGEAIERKKAHVQLIVGELRKCEQKSDHLEREKARLVSLVSLLAEAKGQVTAKRREVADLIDETQRLEQEDTEEVKDVADQIAVSRRREKELCSEIDRLKKSLDLDVSDAATEDTSEKMPTARHSAPPSTLPRLFSPSQEQSLLPVTASTCGPTTRIATCSTQSTVSPTVLNTESRCTPPTVMASVIHQSSSVTDEPVNPQNPLHTGFEHPKSAELPSVNSQRGEKKEGYAQQHDGDTEEYGINGDDKNSGDMVSDTIVIDSRVWDNSKHDSSRTALQFKACARCEKRGYQCRKPISGPEVDCSQCQRDSSLCLFPCTPKSQDSSKTGVSDAESDLLRHLMQVKRHKIRDIYESGVFPDLSVSGIHARWNTLKKKDAAKAAKEALRRGHKSSITYCMPTVNT